MTTSQAYDLLSKGPTWISFYYNRIDYGRLVKNPNRNEWFFIATNARHDGRQQMNWNDDLPEFFEPVDLAMIEVVDGPFESMQDYDSSVVTSEYDETILIVLGAGASYDFNDGSLPGRVKLPLTKDIFSDDFSSIRNRYHGAQSLYNSLVDIDDLEAFFQRKWNLLSRSYNPQLMRDLISCQYYMQELFFQESILSSKASPNFYASLVQQMRDYGAIKRGRVRFLVVNFNYDNLFEQQVEKELGYSYSEINSYDDTSRLIQVFKLHGSSNWCRYLDGSGDYRSWKSSFSIVNDLILNLDNLASLTRLLESKISIMNDTWAKSLEVLNQRTEEEVAAARDPNFTIRSNWSLQPIMAKRQYFPHMLIPYKDKDEFLVPSSQVARLELMLEKCKRVYCIGWKGNEKKFIDMIESSAFDVTWITGPNGKEEILNGEARRLSKSNHRYYTEGFAKCMKHVNTSMDNMFIGDVGIGVDNR
jgi:hypothetical protein